MREQLEQRLQELRAEFESGQKMLTDLDAKKTEVQNALLRISGAIQVLEEFLTKDVEASRDGTGQFEMAREDAGAS